MANLQCPVPNCPKGGYNRPTKVFEHLRQHHGIDLETLWGGNMTSLLLRLQEQFSNWLKANGYPNISIRTGAQIEQPSTQNSRQANGSRSTSDTGANGSEAEKDDDQGADESHMQDGIEELLWLSENTDESDLDVLPEHANDTHTIVEEDGTRSYGERRPPREERKGK